MKWLLRAVVVVVVLVVVALVGVLVFVDPLLEKGIEEGGTYALGVETRLEAADLGLFSGELDLGGLVIANPAGFPAPHFLALESGAVEVTLPSLLEEKVVVPRIELAGIDMHLEEKDGQANFAAILENLRRLGGGEETEPEPAPEGGKQFVIKQLTISDVRVHTRWSGKDVDVRIAAIPLTDVGSESGSGVVLSQLSGIIVQAILEAVARDAGALIPAALVGELGRGLEGLGKIGDYTAGAVREVTGAAGEALEGAVEGVREGVGEGKRQLDEGVQEAGRAVEEAGRAVGKELEGLGGRVGGILGGSRKRSSGEESEEGAPEADASGTSDE